MQAQIQNHIIINKKYKKWRIFQKNEFLEKKPFEDLNEKKIEKTFSLEQTTPWNTRPLKTTIEYGPCTE